MHWTPGQEEPDPRQEHDSMWDYLAFIVVCASLSYAIIYTVFVVIP